MHILRNCEVIKQVWRNLGINSDDNTLFAADLLSWFTVNAKANAGNYRGQPHWSTIFLFAVWSIWLKRNAVVFHNKPFPIDLHFEALQRVKEFYCAANWKAPTQSVHKPIRWEKPPMGWIKLNTDGSLSGDLGWQEEVVCFAMRKENGFLATPDTSASLLVSWRNYGLSKMACCCV